MKGRNGEAGRQGPQQHTKRGHGGRCRVADGQERGSVAQWVAVKDETRLKRVNLEMARSQRLGPSSAEINGFYREFDLDVGEQNSIERIGILMF